MVIKNKKIVKNVMIYCLLIFAVAGLTACSKSNAIVGTWVSENNDDILKFDDNGSCSAPFTYNAAWIESADSYTVKEDGTLVFSSDGGHANDSFKKVDSEEEALDDKNSYYISGDILIIEKDKYTRTE